MYTVFFTKLGVNVPDMRMSPPRTFKCPPPKPTVDAVAAADQGVDSQTGLVVVKDGLGELLNSTVAIHCTNILEASRP